MPLNAKQTEAVEYIEGPLLVLAGPGTGKTHLLSARVEEILRKTDTNPENILCLTFTESGASNMRERLLSTIGSGARRIEIHTYHSFGSDLLAQYKNYAESFDRELNEPISEVLKFKLISEVLGELPAMDILKRGGVSDIMETIGNAKAARLSGDDLIKIAERNTKDSAKISKAATGILEKAKKRAKFHEAVEMTYWPLLEELAKFVSSENILGEIEPVGNVIVRELKRVIDAEQEKEKPSVSPLSKWKERTFELDSEGHFVLKDRIANKKLTSLGRIMNEYERRLEAEGWFDFEDMIQQAIEILKKDRGFRLTCQERFQYILLDEFQDTNPSQAELIRLLTDYEQPNVMAVGDDDQAIFEFQGADASNLLTFQQHYQAKVVNLEENYRSNQEILDFSRRIADQLGDSFAKSQGVSKRLKAFKGAGAEISRHEFLTSDGEYEFVAKEIEKLLDAGVKQKDIAIIAPKHKYILPILPFLRASGKINVAYEKKDNIFEDVRISEILTLARFIDDVSRGKNVSSRLLQILAFPFFEVPPAEAIRAITAAKEDKKAGLDYLIKAESPKLRELGEFLAKLVVLSFDTSLELMLDYLVGTVAVELPSSELDSKEGALLRRGREFRSPFLEFYAGEQGDYETFELYENLAVLKQALVSHARNPRPKLRDLVEMTKDYEEAKIALTNTSPYRDSEDAIQLLTAHKSKGLEFEYVFMIALDNLSWGGSKGNNNMLALPKNLIQIRHTGATDDERLRLFFVAVTRAKRVLVLSNSTKDFSGKTPGRLSYLNEFVDDSGEVESPFLTELFGEEGGKVIVHQDDLKEARKTIDLRKSWQASYAKTNPELLPILKGRMEKFVMSATNLTDFVDLSYGGPLKFYQKTVLRAPQEPLTETIVFGNLMHATFERITNGKISDEEALKFYREEAERADLEEKEIRGLLEKGEASLKICLESFGSLLRAENAKAEVNLKGEHIEIEGVPATGKIDHMEIDEKAKTIEIYDFKTAKFNDKKWDSNLGLYKYMLQLGFYKLLLNNSNTYRKFKISRGHILFVTPDEYGEVHDKVLEFDEKYLENAEAKLKEMIKAVYYQATNLAFLDDEELLREPNREATFKEVKEFIELLLEKSGENC